MKKLKEVFTFSNIYGACVVGLFLGCGIAIGICSYDEFGQNTAAVPDWGVCCSVAVFVITACIIAAAVYDENN